MNILTPTGYKDISTINVGDDVSAFDIVTGALIVNQVVEIQYIDITTESVIFDPAFFFKINEGDTFYGEQSIWANDNVTHVKLLNVGDTIYDNTNSPIIVSSIEQVSGLGWWRFEISGDHSYIVDATSLHNASRFWVLGTGGWTTINIVNWSATTGGIGGASVPGSSDAVVMDASSGGGTITPNYDMTVVSINPSAFTGTLDFSANNNNPTITSQWSNSGTGTRTINMGNGIWTVSGNNTTIWTQSIVTNLTFNANSSTLKFTYAGSTGTRTIAWGSTLTYNNVSITAGSDTVATGSSILLMSGDYSEAGFTGTHTLAANMTVGGNFTLGTGSLFTSTGGTLTLNSNSSVVITTNGVNINKGIVIGANGGTGTFTLAGALDMSGSIAATLNWNAGTFNTNNFNITTPMFVTSNANVRTWNAGTTTLTITGNNATVCNIATITNATINATNLKIVFNYSGSTGTRVLGLNSAIVLGDITINAATDILQFSLNVQTGGIFTCNMPFSSNVAGSSRTITAKSFVFSGVTSISDISLTMGNNSGSFTMTEALNFTGTVAGALTLTGGSFDSGGFAINAKSITSSNSNTRSINLRSSVITISGTGTVWSLSTSTGLTFTAGTSQIIFNDTTSSAKNMSLGVSTITYNNIKYTGGGTGVFGIVVTSSAPTITTFTVDPGLTVQVTGGGAINVTNINWSGTAGNLNTFKSATPGTAWFVNSPSGNIIEDYISLQDSFAGGGAVFYAGMNSIDVSGNEGWIFEAPTTYGGNFFLFM